MSKKSRERKRLIREALAKGADTYLVSEAKKASVPTQSQLPIVGNFEQRAAEIIRQDNQKTADKSDNRLPEWYRGFGNGHYVHHGNDIGYRPINHDQDKKIFNIKSTDITEGSCPIAKIPKVYVSNRLWGEWINLAMDYSTEWLAYLTGQFVKDDKGPRYEIRKMYFPPQVAHASHVDVDDDFEGYLPNTIGAIHSHVEMGVFFSGEDLAHSNWPVEIVVNAKGEGKVMIRHQLDCGSWIKNYSEILTVGDNADKRYTEALDNAFQAGEKLRQARIAKTASSAGYRMPNVSHQQSQPVNVTLERDKEWSFCINGKPHKWRSMGPNREDGDWVEVTKVNGQWLFIDDPILGSSQVTTDSPVDATVELNEETGQITISDATGHSTDDGHDIVTRPATQEELDKMMEAEVDEASCTECGGTGKVDSQIGSVECMACGGMGVKPEYNRFEGFPC